MVNIDELIESDGLYHTQFSPEYGFTWRLLTLKEYRVFRGLRDFGAMSTFNVYHEVFKRCYVRDLPVMNQRIPFGMLVTIGEAIMWLSGDCELSTLKDDILIARHNYPSDSVNERMKQVVFTTFPSYKLEELDQWTRTRLIKSFVTSEHVLIQRGFEYQPIDVNEIKRPDEVAEVQELPDKYNNDIDFAREAKAQRKELGGWAEEDQLEREHTESQRLTTKQAQALDKMRATRGN